MVRIKRYRSAVAAVITVLGLVGADTAMAQTTARRQKYDSIAAKYKGERAVYTEYTERLVISEDEGQLRAHTDAKMEKLLLTDLAATTDNVEYFSQSDFHPLTALEGYALVPTKTDYKNVKVTGFGEGGSVTSSFMDDVRGLVAYYSGVSKGSVLTTSYSTEHTDLKMLDWGILQHDIPSIKTTFEVVAPSYVKLNFMVKGQDTSMIRRTVEQKDGNTIYRFTAANVPASKSYSNVPSALYYAPHVVPYISSFRKPGAKKDSLMLSNLDNFYKYQYQYIKGLNIKTDDQLAKTVAEVTRGAYSDREKAENIYKWVQKNMHYIAFECGLEGFVPRPADTVLKRKYGDCKDMASILTAMCRTAGLNAYCTWIGSNNKPYTHDDIVAANLYDHMICAVKLGEEYVFLDGTDRYLPFGANREDLQGKEAFVAVDAKNYKVVKLPEAPAERSVLTDNTTMTIVNSDVTGNVTQHYTGYEAWDLIHAISRANRKDRKDKLVRLVTERGSDKYVVPRYDMYAQETGNMDVNINAEYNLGSYVQHVGKQCIVNMNVKRTFSDMRVNDSGRVVPVFYDHKKTVRETVTLNIPDGYRVQYLPKAAQGGVDGLWSYKISYREDKAAKKVIQTKEYVLNTMKIMPAQFEANNKLTDALRKEYKETVVLTAKK